MAKFTKYNNPNRRRKPRRKLDYNEKMIAATKEMLIDQQLGYEIPVSYYEEKVKEETNDSSKR